VEKGEAGIGELKNDETFDGTEETGVDSTDETDEPEGDDTGEPGGDDTGDVRTGTGWTEPRLTGTDARATAEGAGVAGTELNP